MLAAASRAGGAGAGALTCPGWGAPGFAAGQDGCDKTGKDEEEEKKGCFKVK